MNSELYTEISGEFQDITFPIPAKFYTVAAPVITNYFEIPHQGLGYKETKVDPQTKIERNVYSVVHGASPYVVGFKYCWNYKELLKIDLAAKLVVVRVFKRTW